MWRTLRHGVIFFHKNLFFSANYTETYRYSTETAIHFQKYITGLNGSQTKNHPRNIKFGGVKKSRRLCRTLASPRAMKWTQVALLPTVTWGLFVISTSILGQTPSIYECPRDKNQKSKKSGLVFWLPKKFQTQISPCTRGCPVNIARKSFSICISACPLQAVSV